MDWVSLTANSRLRRKLFLIRSTSRLIAQPCAGSFSALRGLTFSTFASDHNGTPKSWGYNLFINVCSVCLALPFAKSIFPLRKLRNVGSSKQKSRFYQPPSPSEICRDVPARRSISVGWSWLPPGCCPLNSTANRMGGANSTIGGLSICTTS